MKMLTTTTLSQMSGQMGKLENQTAAPQKSRFNGFGLRSIPGDQSIATKSLGQEVSKPTKTWGSNVFGPYFGGSSLENSTSHNSLRPESESFEPTTGSASLYSSSEIDPWQNQRKSKWAPQLNAPSSQIGSKSVSPAPRANDFPSQPTPSQSYFKQMPAIGTRSHSHSNEAIAGLGSREAKNFVTELSSNFLNSFDDDSALDDFSYLPSIKSSNSQDPYRIAPDPFGHCSSGASRNGSLPPSRHGNETFSSDFDAFSRFPSRPAPPSLTNPSAFTERTHSFDDAVNDFEQLSLRNGDPVLQNDYLSRRPSAPNSGHSLSPTESYHSQLPNEYTINGAYNPYINGSSTDNFNHFRSNQNRQTERNGYQNSFSNKGSYTHNMSPYSPSADASFQGRSRPHWRQQSGGGASQTSNRQVRSYQPDYPPNSAYTPPQFSQMQPMLSNPYAPSSFAQNPYLPNTYTNTYQNNAYNPTTYQPNMQSYSMYMSNGYAGHNMMTQQPSVPSVQHYSNGQSNSSGNGSRDIQSTKLREFHTNYAARNADRYELKEVFNHVVEFSGDQLGSRFLQKKLETANSDEKTTIFKEILPNAPALAKDVFGNYVIQRLFEHCDLNQKTALAQVLKGNVFRMSCQTYGCRVIQKAFEHILVHQQAELVREISDYEIVVECLKDQNGNHVIQKAIEVIPSEHIQGIYKALFGKLVQWSNHGYGCRVLQRMLEKNDDHLRAAVLAELAGNEAEIIVDQFGNYVAQHIITHGDPVSKNHMIQLILQDVPKYAQHKFASNVVEKCIAYGTLDQQLNLLNTILSPPLPNGSGGLVDYVKCGYGNYVIQTLLERLPDDDGRRLYNALGPALDEAKNFIAKKTLDGVREKMQRFDSPTASYAIALESNSKHAPQSTPTSTTSSVMTTSTALTDLPSLSSSSSTIVPVVPEDKK